MFNWITKGDLEKLLAAGGTSLETVLQKAGAEAQDASAHAQGRIKEREELIAEMIAANNSDKKAVREASVIARIVHTLGG